MEDISSVVLLGACRINSWDMGSNEPTLDFVPFHHVCEHKVLQNFFCSSSGLDRWEKYDELTRGMMGCCGGNVPGYVVGMSLLSAYMGDVLNKCENERWSSLLKNNFLKYIYIIYSSSSGSVSLAMSILSAIDSVKSWMSSNRLRLNYDKTQFIWFGTRQQLAKRDIHQLQAVSEALTSDDSVRNLGVLVDSELKFHEHFSKLSQNCFFQLRRMRSIRRSVSREAMLTLACIHQ